MRLGTAFVLAAVCSVLLLSAGSAHAADVKVDCNKKKTINSALAGLSKQGPNTIHVSGTCNENVVIDGFDNLTLLANRGASLSDPTPSTTDDNNVVDISNSQRVTIEGFTINQGFSGLVCGIYSTCFLNNNIVQGAFGDAVLVGRGSLADLNNDTVQNSASGLRVQFGGQAHIFGGTIEGNDGPGAFATHQGLLDLRGGVSVQNNGTDGADGIAAAENSTIFLGGATITGNGGNGVSVNGGSVLQVGGAIEITGNGAVGVYVGNSAFAFISGAANVSLNTGSPQAVCAGHFSVVQAVGTNAGLSCINP